MSLLRKAALVNGSAFVGILFGILQTVIVTRVLGPEGVGRYSLVVAALMLVTQLFSFGLPLSYLYYSQRNRENTRTYLMNAVWLELARPLLDKYDNIYVSIKDYWPHYFRHDSQWSGRSDWHINKVPPISTWYRNP